MTAATAAQCPAGGTILVVARDTTGTGVLSPLDTGMQSAVICSGRDGTDGAVGAAGATGSRGPQGPAGPLMPVSLIRPCGASSSPWKEVLLCLADGTLLADFSDDASGRNTRLSLVPPGTYEDTDASGCIFVVSEGTTGLDVSWPAGSNQFSTWQASTVKCGGSSEQQ